MTSARFGSGPTWVITASPTAPTARPAGQPDTTAGIRRTATVASIDATMIPTAQGTSHRPACRASIPTTSSRYWAMNRNTPAIMTPIMTLTATEMLNAGCAEQLQVDQRVRRAALSTDEDRAERDSGDDGDDRCRPDAVLGDPLDAVDHGEYGDQRQRGAGQVEPAGARVVGLGQQERPDQEQQRPSPAGSAGRPSPTRSARAASRRSAARSRRRPRKRSPIRPMATVRWAGSTNRLRSNESVDGIRVAPATPSTARARISSSALDANAASRLASPHAAAPIRSSRRRPIRSPSVPIVISEPAMRKP